MRKNLPTTVLILLLSFNLPFNSFCQDDDNSLFDILDEIEAEADTVPQKPAKVYETFGGTHLINGESVETIDKNVWSFIISHRFGRVNGGWRDFFGLDQASVRIAMEYGILENLTVGAARSTFEKTYDFYVKYRFLEQREKGMPISVAYFGDIAINSQKFVNNDRDNYFSSRLSYTNQLLISRKFNDWFSLQIMPTVVHQNLTTTTADPNTLFVFGLGAKVKVNKRMALLAEYYPRIKDNPDSPYTDAFAFGVDLVTGGHVFQFQFTNSNAMHTAGFTRKTTGDFFKGDIHFGFNISRTFGKNAPKRKKKSKKESKELIESEED